MIDLLRAVPRDVFLLILDAVRYLFRIFPLAVSDYFSIQLPKADLKTLSQASSWLRDSVASTLWKSITIKSRGESHLHDLPTNGLPYRRLRTATQLHLRASFTRVTDNRCPHIYDYPRSTRSGDDDEIYDEPQREFYFDDFADKVESLLGRMEPDQLQSFRQEPGDTLPPRPTLLTLLQLGSRNMHSGQYPWDRRHPLTSAALTPDVEFDNRPQLSVLPCSALQVRARCRLILIPPASEFHLEGPLS